jgi:hypothetical protein
MNGYSRLAIIGALVAVAAFGTGAVLFLAGDDAIQRLGILFALFGTIVAGLLSTLRADSAATQTSITSNIANGLNGAFDQRVRNAVRMVVAEPARTPIEAVDMPGDAIAANPPPLPPPSGGMIG